MNFKMRSICCSSAMMLAYVLCVSNMLLKGKRKRKSYALRIHPRRELRKVVSLSRTPPPLTPARLELGTFEDKSSQPQFNIMLRTKRS